MSSSEEEESTFRKRGKVDIASSLGFRPKVRDSLFELNTPKGLRIKAISLESLEIRSAVEWISGTGRPSSWVSAPEVQIWGIESKVSGRPQFQMMGLQNNSMVDEHDMIGAVFYARNVKLRPFPNIRNCLLILGFCSLFREGYEIQGDMLVHLWIAAGFIQREPSEDIARGYLRGLVQTKVISFSRKDLSTGNNWYKIQDMSDINLDGVADKDMLVESTFIKGIFHPRFQVQSTLNDDLLNQDRMMLLLKSLQSSNITSLDNSFFLSMELLQALDLSSTLISDLPSSIGNAKCLRYLNLSNTPIKRLPGTIRHLQVLQTLKLVNCSHLVALPQTINRVTSLKYLDLGALCHLDSMPPGIGALTGLHTLSNFVVGEESECSIAELKGMNGLWGRVCLSKLENVRSKDEAKVAYLGHKHKVTELELRWSHKIERGHSGLGDDCIKQVIEHLQPSRNLDHLRIVCYPGSVFPSWISDPWFNNLVSITLFQCEEGVLLPSLGMLPSLQSLYLTELVLIKTIEVGFCADPAIPYRDTFVAFPKLKKLEIKSMLSLQEWSDMREGYFPCLTELTIINCPELDTLCRLSNFSSLQCLEIKSCPKVPFLPDGGLPTTLKTLVIDNCPLLIADCSSSMEDALDWNKLNNTPDLLVYQRT